MSRSLKRALAYIIIPALFLSLSYGVYKLACIPLEQFVKTQVYAAIVKGNPDYSFNPEFSLKSKVVVKKSEIKTPSVGNEYGMITCEEIDLMAPLYFGDSEKVLELGAGQYIKSKLPGFGGTILVGGHDTSFFAPLEEVKVGQQITITTDYGTYLYEVRETTIAKTDDLEASQLDKDSEQLVLYTCYPFGELLRARDERFFIYCDKVAGPDVEES